MKRAGRARVLVGLVLTLALVVPLGTMWWHSRMPSSYSAMDMGEPAYGGGPAAEAMGHTLHDGGLKVSVADLDTDATRTADVRVDFVAREGRVRLASGRNVDGFSVNGSSPGPLIEATVGDLVQVRLRNESVRGGVALHWHGIDVPNAEDGVAGVTQDAVKVGEEFVYRWVAVDSGTYWYHSHQLSHEQVSGGLLGGILVRPAMPDPEVRDLVVIGHLYGGRPTLSGLEGDRAVEARPSERVRVRLVNTDNGPSRAWASVPFVLRAVDGVDVHDPSPVTQRWVGIPAGGRADLEVQIPADGSAVRVQLQDNGVVLGPRGARAPPVPVPGQELDLLSYGSPTPLGFDPTAPDRSFEYSIGRRPGFVNGRPGLWWSVNGHLYPEMPIFVVKEGDVVHVRISNHSGEVHPMHLHGHHAVVLARNGVHTTGSAWWFDSLDVEDGATYDVAFLADNPGIWMDHCHNLKHAREGLVTHLMYEGVSTPYRIGSGSGNTPE